MILEKAIGGRSRSIIIVIIAAVAAVAVIAVVEEWTEAEGGELLPVVVDSVAVGIAVCRGCGEGNSVERTHMCHRTAVVVVGGIIG